MKDMFVKPTACILGLLAAYSQITPAIATNEIPSDIRFHVEARGIDGGLFVVSQRTEGERRIVDVTAKLKFKLGFITLKKVEHRSQEIWVGDQLVSLESKTKKGRELIKVSAELVDDHLEVNSSESGVLQMPLDSAPTSFTKPNLFVEEQPRTIDLLDTLNGIERPSLVRFRGVERKKLNGAVTDMRYFTVESRETGRITHEFWIDDADIAMLISMHTEDGTTVEYSYAG